MTTTTMFARVVALAFSSLLCVCASAAAAAPSQNQDSVAYQINQDHSGDIAFNGGFSGSLTQLWSVNLNGVVSYPVTGHGKAFVTIGADGGSLLAAINMHTGVMSWEKLLPGSSSWADATYDDGKVFVVNGDGDLLAYGESGKPLWSAQLNSGVGAPAASNGMVVLQYDSSESYEQTVSAYDEASGANLWTVSPGYYQAGTGIGGVPVLTKSGVYLSSNEGFYGLSSSDGSTVWSATLGCELYDTPVRSENNLFVADTYDCYPLGENTIFDLANGSVKGSFSGSNAPVVLGRTLIISLDGVLYDYSPRNGDVHWSFTSGYGNMSSKPIVINGYVAALDDTGNLYLLDGSTGAQLWTTMLTFYDCCGGQGPDAGLEAGEGVLLVPFGGGLNAFAPQEGARLGSRPEPTRVIGHLINGRYVPG